MLALDLYLQALVNAPFYRLRNLLKLTRRGFAADPCQRLQGVAAPVLARIKGLKAKYDLAFERHLPQTETLENYHILDILDQARTGLGFAPASGGEWVDVGCKNFYYARALDAFFRPARLTGLEIDAYKPYRDLHTRFSYAQFYIRDLPALRYVAGDFLKWEGVADGITLFLPFVTAAPLVRWTLPLSLFRPQALFDQAFHVLRPGGRLFVMNMNGAEFAATERHALRTGFVPHGRQPAAPLCPREEIPVLSVWGK